jgi:hypothetical protein
LTLVELLAGLTLTALLAGGVFIALHLEGRVLPATAGRDVVQTGLVSMSQHVAESLQNAMDVRRANDHDVLCDTVDGGTVELRFDTISASAPIPESVLRVVTTPPGGTAQLRTWQWPMTTLAGSTFEVHGSLVTVHLRATYLGPSVLPAEAAWDETYSIGGGN